MGVESRRQGRGIPAEYPRGGGRPARLRLHRRGLVELLPRLRCRQRRRPFQTDRAQGPPRGRRLPLRRQGLRQDRGRREAAGGDTDATEDRRTPLPCGRSGHEHSGERRDVGRPLVQHEGAELAFEQVPFDHPLWVLYSSGTTGLPKAIVQSQGGILIEHLKKVVLHIDLGPDDRFFWFTTTGWMMWNLVVGGPALGGDCHPALRRQPRLPRHERPLGVRREDRHDLLRDQRELHHSLHEGRHRAEARTSTCRT